MMPFVAPLTAFTAALIINWWLGGTTWAAIEALGQPLEPA
jgi:hypothetical protein